MALDGEKSYMQNEKTARRRDQARGRPVCHVHVGAEPAGERPVSPHEDDQQVCMKEEKKESKEENEKEVEEAVRA